MGRMEAATKKPKVKAADVAYEPGLLVRLKDASYAADYLATIAEDGDPAAFLLALRQIAQAQGMAGVARRAKLGRESLYKALSEGGTIRNGAPSPNCCPRWACGSVWRRRRRQRSEPMNNVMTIDGHKAVIAFDPEISMFRGEFSGLSGVADFYAIDVGGLQREGATSLRTYLDACQADGIDPLAKASGTLVLRVPPAVHRAATLAAKAQGKSLNQWAGETLREAAQA